MIDQLGNVFVFDLETHNNQAFAETYTAELYDVNRLCDRWDRDLTPDEILIEEENVVVFDGSNGNPVMNMPKYTSEIYEGDKKTYIDKDGDEIVSSYRLFLVPHNARGFDSWVVLKSSVKEITEIKIIKTASARGLIPLAIRCGVEIVNTSEVPHYVNFTFSKSHLRGPLEKIGRG